MSVAGLLFFLILLFSSSEALVKTKTLSRLKAFQLWMIDHEAQFPFRIAERKDGSGYRYISDDSFDADEPVMHFPSQLLITSQKARNSRLKMFIEKLEAESGKLLDEYVLALFVAFERNVKTSFWTPFFKVVLYLYSFLLDIFTDCSRQILECLLYAG
jgi:hypothetical protein